MTTFPQSLSKQRSVSTFPAERPLPPKNLIWFPQAPPIMTATQILKVVCILLFPSILRSCVHAKKTRKRQNKAGSGREALICAWGSSFTYRSLGGGGLLRGASVGGAGLSTGCNCSLQEIDREMSAWTNFSIQPNYLALSEHLVLYPQSVWSPVLPPMGTCTTLAQLIIPHTATLTLMPKSTVNTQTFPAILAICWAN